MRLQNLVATFLFVIAAWFEIFLIASQENVRRHLGNEAGIVEVRWDEGTAKAISWLVVLVLFAALIVLEDRLTFPVLFVLALIVAPLQLAFGRHLPAPQDRWEIGVALLVGVGLTLVKLLRDREILQRFLERFRFSTT